MNINEVKSNKTYTTQFGGHFNNLIVFGNPDVPTEFQNHTKMEFWGENYISFHNEGIKGIPKLEGERLILDTPEKTYYWEPKNQKQMRWVEFLKVKPTSNKWVVKLEGHEDFNFKYQPSFEVMAQSIPGSFVEYFKQDGEDWVRLVHPQGGSSERPLNIDGSYAVKHKTKRNHAIGGTNYKTGKVLHIPRPKATDAVGKSVLCELHIENGVYTRTTSQSFLNSAVYPVVINDILEDNEVGGTTLALNANMIAAVYCGDMPQAGTLDSVHIYDADASADLGFYFGLYSGTAGGALAPVTRVWKSAEITDRGADVGWEVVTAGNEVLGNGLEMYPAIVPKADTDFKLAYDVDASYWIGRDTDVYDIPTPPPAWDDEYGYEGSAYVTYTPTVAGMSGAMTTNTGYWGW